MDPNYPASANPRTGMIGNDHQGMSPRRPTVLEGELIGPSNGVAATQPRRQQLGAEAPGDKAMANGVSSTEGMDPPRPDQDEGSQPVMSPPVPSVSDFLSTSAALNRDDQGATFSAGVPPEVQSTGVDLSQGGVRVQAGGFEFSPPEAFPSEQPQPSTSTSTSTGCSTL